MSEFVPAEAIPPGEFIQEELEARGWTQQDLASILKRPLRTINRIILGKHSITAETAKELAEAFGTDATYWMRLEAMYRLALAEGPKGAVQERAAIYSLAPIKEMVRRGWIRRSEDDAQLRRELERFYGAPLENRPVIAFAARHGAELTPEIASAQLAWACRAKHVAALAWADRFTKSRISIAVRRLRQLVHEPEEVRHVPKVLAEAGIRLVVTEALKHTRIDGAALWLGRRQPVIALSMRYGRLDYFWFTLLHELAHIAAGDGECGDADLDAGGGETQAETRANRKAAGWLIPPNLLASFIMRTTPLYSSKRISGFANRIGVHPSIVTGQLCHRGELTWDRFARLRVDVRRIVLDACIHDGWGTKAPVVTEEQRE